MGQMVMRMPSLAVFSYILLFTPAVLADDAWEPCPPWKYGSQSEAVPDQTVCSTALNTHFNRSDAYMTVTLRQTNET